MYDLDLEPWRVLVLCRLRLGVVSPVQINLSRLKVVSNGLESWRDDQNLLLLTVFHSVISKKSDFSQCSHSHLLSLRWQFQSGSFYPIYVYTIWIAKKIRMGSSITNSDTFNLKIILDSFLILSKYARKLAQ